MAFQHRAAWAPEFIAMLLQTAEEISALFDGMTEPANVGTTGRLLFGCALLGERG
jgi:hypothetical protein